MTASRFLVFLLSLAFSVPAIAQDAQTILHLLDYVGVDYPEAVAGGKVKNEDEYKEMLEFTAQATERLKALPENPARAGLVTDAQALAKLVKAKGDAAAVALHTDITPLARAWDLGADPPPSRP